MKCFYGGGCCDYFDLFMTDNCTKGDPPDVKNCKLRKELKTAEAKPSSTNDGLCNMEVQTAKDAMWLIDNVLLRIGKNLDKKHRDMAQKVLRQMHNSLDKAGLQRV